MLRTLRALLLWWLLGVSWTSFGSCLLTGMCLGSRTLRWFSLGRLCLLRTRAGRARFLGLWGSLLLRGLLSLLRRLLLLGWLLRRLWARSDMTDFREDIS